MNKDPMLQSKKFVAFIISEILWKLLIGLIIYYNKDDIGSNSLLVLLTIIVVAGTVEIGFILGLVSLDKFLATVHNVVDDVTHSKKKEDTDNGSQPNP